MRVVPRMPEAGANGAAETLHGQMSGSFLRGMPPDERSDNAEIADRIDPERRSNAQAGHDDAAQCRPDCATHIEAHAVRSHRGSEILLGHELRNDRLPGGSLERTGYPDEKGKKQQVAGRREVEPYDRGED